MRVLDGEEHPARRASPLTDRLADDPRAGADDDRDRSTGDRERHPNEEPSQAEDAQGAEHDRHNSPHDPLIRPNETQRGPDEHEDSGHEAEDEPETAQEERPSVVRRKQVGQIDDAHQEDEDPPDQTKHERDRTAAVAYHGSARAGIGGPPYHPSRIGRPRAHEPTRTSSPSTRTSNVRSRAAGLIVLAPVRTSYSHPCTGHVTTGPSSSPTTTGPLPGGTSIVFATRTNATIMPASRAFPMKIAISFMMATRHGRTGYP